MFARKKLLRERLVHDHDLLGSAVVAIAEIAPLQNRDMHGVEILRGDRRQVRGGLVAFRDRMFWIFKADGDPVVCHREHHHSRGGLHAGQRTHFFKIRAIELRTSLCVLGIRQFEIHGGQMVGIETFIRMNQPAKTADKQSSRSGQQQAHCDLSHD